MSERVLLAAAIASLLAACSAHPQRPADVDSYTLREYRTGSNIPVKDYGVPDVDVVSREVLNPANRRPLDCSAKGAGVGC